MLDIEFVPPDPQNRIEFDAQDPESRRQIQAAEPDALRIDSLPALRLSHFGPTPELQEPQRPGRIHDDVVVGGPGARRRRPRRDFPPGRRGIVAEESMPTTDPNSCMGPVPLIVRSTSGVGPSVHPPPSLHNGRRASTISTSALSRRTTGDGSSAGTPQPGRVITAVTAARARDGTAAREPGIETSCLCIIRLLSSASHGSADGAAANRRASPS